MARTIFLKGAHHEEYPANAALNPGHLVEVLSTGKVRKHATEGGNAELLFAKEDALRGKTVDDAYAQDDVVPVLVGHAGTVVNAVLKAGVSYAKGDALISAGDGTLKKASAAGTGVSVKRIVAFVVEAKDLSAGGAVASLAAVRLN